MKTTEKSNLKNIQKSQIFVITKMLTNWPKFKYSYFLVLIDSTNKTLGYRRSCGVNFENFEFFIFTRGPNWGLNISSLLKTVEPHNDKREIKKHVS